MADDQIESVIASWGATFPTSAASAEPNRVLAYPAPRELILPAYVACVIKSLRNMNSQTQTIDLAITLVVRIECASLPEELRDELTQSLAFRFNETPLNYDPDHADGKWKGSLFAMTMRINLNQIVFVGEDIDFTVWKKFPFDTPDLSFRLEFTSHTIKDDSLLGGQLKGWKVRYNVHQFLGRPEVRHSLSFMDRIRPMMSFKSNHDSLPSFVVDMAALAVTFAPERKTTNGVTFTYFATVTFHIPLFRHPGGPLRSMVFPLIVTDLGIIMTLFMLPTKYEERIATLVTVLLALFAFLNFARASLPDVPVSTWLDTQIFWSVCMCCFGMLETLLCKYEYVDRALAADVHNPFAPSQWSFSRDYEDLSPAQQASRVVRYVILALLNLVLFRTLCEILYQLSIYWRRVATNDSFESLNGGEMKKRSTDFDKGAYGWPELAVAGEATDAVVAEAKKREALGRRLRTKPALVVPGANPLVV